MQFVVVYAKITTDKDTGVTMQGIYYGGLGDTKEQAEALAKECVNTNKGGVVMPKIMKLEGIGKLIDVMYDSADVFDKVVKQMQEAEETLKHNRRK